MILITNAIGTFILENKKIVDKRLFKNPEEWKNDKIVQHYEQQLLAKFPNAKKQYTVFPQTKEFYPFFITAALEQATIACQAAVKKEHLIIEAVAFLHELEKTINVLVKRLQHWYALYFPELEQRIGKQETFVECVLTKSKEDMMKEFHLKQSLGASLSGEERKIIETLAEKIKDSFALKKTTEEYVETTMQQLAPNTTALAGSIVAAELISKAGSLERLATLPSSTIQILGAEEALFRHLRKQGKPPRHGVILMHPLLANAKEQYHGKIARKLAGKISLAAKCDYFKGDHYTGYELSEKLEKEVEKIKNTEKKRTLVIRKG